MSGDNRNITIDFIKGAAIILMVMGHALADWPQGGGLRGFIGMFHMPVFFIASGYFFRGDRLFSLGDVRRYIGKKVLRLYLPYVFWTLVFLMLHNLFIKWNIYTDNIALNQFVKGELSNAKSAIGIEEGFQNILWTAIMVYRPEPMLACWFLKALLFITVGYSVVEFTSRRLSYNATIVQSFVALVLLVLYRYHPKVPFDALIFHCGGSGAFYGYFFFHLGRVLNERKINFEINSVWVSASMVFVSVSLLIAAMYLSSGIRMHRISEALYLPIFVSSALVGWILLCEVANVSHGVGVLISYIGRNTMPILLFHFLAFKLVNYIGTLYYSHPAFVTAGFPASYHSWTWTLVYTLVGVALPLMASRSYSRIKDFVRGLTCKMR